MSDESSAAAVADVDTDLPPAASTEPEFASEFRAKLQTHDIELAGLADAAVSHKARLDAVEGVLDRIVEKASTPAPAKVAFDDEALNLRLEKIESAILALAENLPRNTAGACAEAKSLIGG